LFVLVSSFIYFSVTCKLITLSFSVHVKLFYNIIYRQLAERNNISETL